MRAFGFVDLNEILVTWSFVASPLSTETYASMVGTELASTAANSFEVCGLLPVFSS